MKKLWTFLAGTLFLLFCCGFIANAQWDPIKGYPHPAINGDPNDWEALTAAPIPTFTHVIDPFDGTTLDDQFTTGSRDDNFKTWTLGQVKNKSNIANGCAVLIDGILYFAGDRTKTNGDAQIGFWFFKSGCAPVPQGALSGTFEPPRGVGDILILSDFSNGGVASNITVYSVTAVDPGTGILTLTAIPVQPASGVAINNGGSMPVPATWQFETTTYPMNAFYEGFVNLAEILKGVDLCFSSFMLECRSSQSISASLDDFCWGQFNTKPVVEATGGSICAPGGTVSLCATSTTTDLAYNWYSDAALTLPVGTGACISVSVTSTTTYWVTGTKSCTSDPVSATATVNPSPVCSVTGPSSVCPISTNEYCAPAGMAEYTWSVTGAAIDGAADGQCVKIIAPDHCGEFTVTLTIKDALGCTSTCQKVVSVSDTEPPVIANCPTTIVDLGCNPEPFKYEPSLVPEWSDNCGGIKESGVRKGTPKADAAGCGWSVTHVFYAVDYCGNEKTCEQTFKWKVDLTPPSLSNLPAGGELGCNPTPPVCSTSVTATDLCDGDVSVLCEAGEVVSDGCKRVQVFTYSAVDICGNTTSATVSYSWKVDTEAPKLVNVPDDKDLGCNPADLPECGDFRVTATDNCDAGIVVSCKAGDVVVDGCFRSQTFTWEAKDECGNPVSDNATFTWKVDTEAPKLVGVPDDKDLGCNPADLPECGDFTVTATDNCDANIVVTCKAGDIVVDGCYRSQTFIWEAKDECGNPVSDNATFTWKVDTEAPKLVGVPEGKDLGCNPRVLPVCADFNVTATDNCDAGLLVTCKAGEVITDGCKKSQTFTFEAKDECGNPVSASATYTWKVDVTPPVFKGLPEGKDLGCNPVNLPNCGDWNVEAIDDCDGPVPFTCTPSDPVQDGCKWSQIFTFKTFDECLNPATASVTFTWKVDTKAPELFNLAAGGYLGCNPTAPVCSKEVTAKDNCDVNVTVDCAAGAITEDGCMRRQVFTYSAVDLCGNAVSATVVYTWKVDKDDPVFIGCPDQYIDLGCNPAKLPSCEMALALVTVNDKCDGSIIPTCEAGEIGGDGCNRKQAFILTAKDDCGNDATCLVVYTWKVDLEPPKPDITLTDLEFKCGAPVIIPSPVFTDNCDGLVSYDCAVTGAPGADCWTYEYPIGKTEICFSAIDKCGNSIVICILVKVVPCDEFCTYTQGKYGNQDKSTACILAPGKIPTSEMVAGLLAQGDLKIGAGSNYILFKAGDAGVINSIMPGGSSCNILNGICIPGGTVAACLTPYLSRQGRLNSGLISQTLALGLNLRIKSGLGALPLEAGKYLTTQKKLDCPEGTGVVDMVCTPVYGDPLNPTVITGYNMTTNPYWYYKLPEGVLCFMGEKGYAMNVGGLYALANDVLGGVVTIAPGTTCGGKAVTACAIQSAVDMINNAFDECRMFVGNLTDKFSCPAVSGAKTATILTDNEMLNVYPNPFKNVVTLEFTSQKNAKAVLEIHNSLGQKVVTLLDRNVEQGVRNRVDYAPVNQAPGIYLYQLKLDNAVFVGKLIYNKD